MFDEDYDYDYEDYEDEDYSENEHLTYDNLSRARDMQKV